MSLRESIVPGVSRRSDFPLKGKKAALLIIDIQQYLSMPASAEDAKNYLFSEALPTVVPNIEKLAKAFRVVRDDPEQADQHTGCEVLFSYLQAKTVDGRDISTDYKLSGPKLAHIPRTTTSPDDLFLSSCKPSEFTGKGDILLPKTSCSVFQSTNLDYILRNLGVEQLVIAGQLTDECVASAVRDAADLGYLVTVPQDACAAASEQQHLQGLEAMQGFCRVLNSAQVMDEILEDMLDTNIAVLPSQAAQQPELTDNVVVEYFLNKGVDEARALAEHLVSLIMQSEVNMNGGGEPKAESKSKKKKSKKDKKSKYDKEDKPEAVSNESIATEAAPQKSSVEKTVATTSAAESKSEKKEPKELSYMEKMMAACEDSSEELSDASGEEPVAVEEAPAPEAVAVEQAPVAAAEEPAAAVAEAPAEPTPEEILRLWKESQAAAAAVAPAEAEPQAPASAPVVEEQPEPEKSQVLADSDNTPKQEPNNMSTDDRVLEYLRARKLDGPANQLTKMFEANKGAPTRSKSFGGDDKRGKSKRGKLRRGVSEQGGDMLAEMAALAESSSDAPADITDDFVLDYLREKGFDGAASYLGKVFEQKNRAEKV